MQRDEIKGLMSQIGRVVKSEFQLKQSGLESMLLNIILYYAKQHTANKTNIKNSLMNTIVNITKYIITLKHIKLLLHPFFFFPVSSSVILPEI